MASEVPHQPEGDPPGDPAERIPEEEVPEAHVVDARQPRRRDPDQRHPAGHEHGLTSVLLKELVAGADQQPPPGVEQTWRLQHLASELAAEEITDVVAHDRRYHA